MSLSNNTAYGPASVLSESQWLQLNNATATLNSNQLTWVSGYLAGLAQVNQAETKSTPQATSTQSLTILYGSQTGNAKGVAEEYKATAEAAGVSVSIANMADYKPRQLKNESHLLIVVSTHGEGEAPDDAVELHEFLASKKAPKLPNLKYSVLGLGDSSYEFFCQTAQDFDNRLAALGAQSLVSRVDCDVDYEATVSQWSEELTPQLKLLLQEETHSQVVPLPGVKLVSSTQGYNKKNPFSATLLESQKITGRDSQKDIRHIEISLEGSGLHYQPGDALGVWFTNSNELVDQLIQLLDADGDELVTISDQKVTFRKALIDKLELTQSYPTFVSAYADIANNKELSELVANKTALRNYLSDKQIIDVVRQYPTKISAQQFTDALRGLTPRLYSIASSQAEVEEEVHLTVAVVEYEEHGYPHQGGASSFLGRHLESGGEVKVFVESNGNFRLPQNPDTPVIMVGPGTGIAPFRAFMQQREYAGDSGKNWLFFGNPHFTQDFLYQTEWQSYVKSGLLNKISLAFSRDQQQKVYVQHKLLEQGEEIYQWLQQGAHFYICGDADQMAKDVHQALLDIVQKYGNQDPEQAESYLTELRKEKRYQKDVY